MTPLHIGPERSRRHGTIFVHVIGWFCYGHYRMVSQKVVENCRQRKSNKVVLNPQKVSRYNISPNPLWLVVAQMDLRHEDSYFWIGIFVAHLGRQICPSLLSPVFVSSFCLQVLPPILSPILPPILSPSIASYFVSKYCLSIFFAVSVDYYSPLDRGLKK